jgi:exopolysaccharide biosynthesis polyprenyl glycosylphosphotransferase
MLMTVESPGTRASLRLPRQRTVFELVPSIPLRRRLDWQVQYVVSLVLLDAIAFGFAGGVALLTRFGSPDIRFDGVVPYWIIIAITTPLWIAMVVLSGGYSLHVLGRGTTEYKRIFDATLRLCATLGLIAFGLQLDLARSIVLITLPLSCLTAVALRTMARKVLSRLWLRGHALKRVLVIGHETSAFAMAARLSQARAQGFEVVGVCAPDGADRRQRSGSQNGDERRRLVHRWKVVGSFDDVKELVLELDAHAIVVAPSPSMSAERLRQLAWDLEETGVDMLVAPALVDVAGPRIHVSPVEGQTLLHVQTPRLTGVHALVKITFDRFLSLLALLALAPVLGLISLAIQLESSGPAFFRQVRVGQGGRSFVIYKFRSMYADADKRLAELTEHNAHKAGPLFKMGDDPRVTRVGRVLRRSSMDELPQLLNVLLGHMSLVGPRPPLPSEVERYEVSHVYRRLMVRPGLTGLWQVSGRADLDWTEAVRLDLYYVENWSLTMDLGILWKTLGAVFKGRGAY